MIVYLIGCQICGGQYTDSTKERFTTRENNYKSTHKEFMNKETVRKEALKQKRFHYCSDRHNGVEAWVVTLINSANTLKKLRSKELYWMYKLKS